MSSADFHDYVMRDLFSDIPGITSRKMFGGYGIYKDGIFFAIISDDVLYFKAGEKTIEHFRNAGSKQFSYFMRKKGVMKLNYWTVPDDIFDNKEQLLRWINRAVDVKLSSGRRLKPGH